MPTHKTRALNLLRPSKHQSPYRKTTPTTSPIFDNIKDNDLSRLWPRIYLCHFFFHQGSSYVSGIRHYFLFAPTGISSPLLFQVDSRVLFADDRWKRDRDRERETESGVALAFRKSRRFNRIGRLLEGWGVGGGGSCCVFLRWRGKALFKGRPGIWWGPGLTSFNDVKPGPCRKRSGTTSNRISWLRDLLRLYFNRTAFCNTIAR